MKIHVLTLSAAAVFSLGAASYPAIVPVSYDFGTDTGKVSIADAGLTTYIQTGTSNEVTDAADAIYLDNMVETGADSAAGFYRTFSGLGPTNTSDFEITMTFTWPIQMFSEPDIGIHLFGDTASSTYWNTGIYALVEKDRNNSPLSELEILSGGVKGSLLSFGTIAKDVQTASFTTTVKVEGIYGTYGSDNLQLILTVLTDGASRAITTTVDTTGFLSTQTGFGISMLSDNSNRFAVDTFTVGPFSAVYYSYDQWAASYGVGAATNDFDGDGMINLYEYGVDGNPTNALDQGTLPVFTNSGGALLYIHPQRSDDPLLIYTVETRTNLVDGIWTSDGYTVMGTYVTGETLNFVTNDVATAEDEKFIRLRIEQ